MNKKFSTLVATLLLSGALFTVSAAEISLSDFAQKDGIEYASGNMTFTQDVTIDDYKDYLLIADDNVVVDGQGHTLKGRIVVTGKNVTIKNLVIDYKNEFPENEDGTITVNKTALTVISSSATIINNTIICSSVHWIANGISVFPTSEDATFTIERNRIENANVEVGGWSASGIQVVEGYDLTNTGLTGKTGNTTAIKDFDAEKGLANNTFINVATDYSQTDWSTDTSNGDIKAVQVTPIVKDGNIQNAGAIKNAVKNTNEGVVVNFNGTAAQLQKALGTENVTNNVAVECTDENVLYGTAENPDNGKDVIMNGITPVVKDVHGYKLIENPSNPSEYAMLILTAGADQYVVYQETAGSNIAKVTSASVLEKYKTNPASLWKMISGKNADGTVWYKFENQEGKQLKATGGNNAKDGIFLAKKNVAYNGNGVVLSNIVDDSEYSYGLYKPGNNVLSVADLMWFENDGFSVTIKYQNEKGEFKKEDIAGNPFQKHLTPMYWNNSKFVAFSPATKDNKSFYLKDSEGNYIVAQKYASSGSVTAQSNYTFTTVSETALAHDILRNEGKYFGEFKAEVSAKYTNYKKLEAIDVLKVNLAAGWAEVGRLDLGTKEVPTLAASVSTELKPILISLGNNKVVNPKDLLAKNKFFTVTKLDAKGKVLGKLAVADDLYEGDEVSYACEFVTSYGNELEGQFALTYENGTYVFSNRETPNYRWYLAANTLYEGEAENLYVSGNTIYKIETVANHSANDGYETLSNVKNNKFHIGFSSNVFGGNAWFTENHEGTDNHTIGLNIDQEDALIFTATEYAAARKVEHDKVNTHQDTYIPTDSIYVISTLGYYAGNDYKVTKDTLKVVSYSFVNQYNEPLIYHKNRYVSEVNGYKSVEDAAEAAQKFALRKDNGKLNLRPVNHEYEASSYYYDWAQYQRFNKFVTNGNGETLNYDYLVKAYAGDATQGIVANTWIYNRTENDLFVVEPTEKPMYRPVVNALDTISIFRNDNPKSILFEDKTFLGMENLAQYPAIAPAMVADTAYVRNDTYRPQYMLVVNPKITPAGKWCPIHGDDPTCPDAHKVDSKGWVEGRYLVNLVDTAIAWDIANKHKDNNPYINTEKYYRLGFVQAKHIEDSLIIASTNDTLMVGTEDYNQAKFAFRYVDTDAKSFRIETANYIRLPEAEEAVRDGEGYVKWMNGVVVVVDDIADGDIFNMDEEEKGQPTANEGIATSAISVEATYGAIIIKGAEGKKVSIVNVLGQTIANTVVTSDEATIAAPAGVVVVSVEGEAAVKAIVK